MTEGFDGELYVDGVKIGTIVDWKPPPRATYADVFRNHILMEEIEELVSGKLSSEPLEFGYAQASSGEEGREDGQ